MFKKLKDKIAEEVKQSPLKSVQQLAQAVVSPSSSSVFEPSSSNDKFCIEEGDIEEDEKQEQTKPGGFTSVTLTGQTTSPIREQRQRYGSRSSSGSLMAEADSLFPKFEPQPTNFHVQSDWESASEVEDRYSQLEHINKESLYEAYRKVYNRYNKMKNKYHEVVTHYRQLEREKEKARTVLTETQDKALLRISELKEQCLLEQQAKAHLEEALRYELEERDHIINTLKTKVQYLKGVNDSSVTGCVDASKEESNLIDFTENPSVSTVPLPFDASSSEEKINWFDDRLKNLKNLLSEETSKVEQLKSKLKEVRKQSKDATKEKNDDSKSSQSEQSQTDIDQIFSALITKLSIDVQNLQITAINCSLLKNMNEKSNLEIRLTDDSEKTLEAKKDQDAQRDEIERFAALIKELEDQNKTLIQRLNEESCFVKELKNELNSFNTITDILRKKIKLSNDNFAKNDAINCLITDVENELINEWNTCFQNFLQTRCEVTVLKDTRQDLEKELLRLKDEKVQSENINKEITEKNRKLIGDIEILQKDLKSYQTQIETLSKERRDLKVNNENLEKRIKELEDTLSHNQQLSNEKHEDLQKVADEKNILETKRSSLEAELQNTKSEYLGLLETKQKMDVKIYTLSKESQDAIAEKESLNNRVNELENKLKEVYDDNKMILEARDKLDNQINSLTKLTEELTSEKNIVTTKIFNLERELEGKTLENSILLQEKDELLQELGHMKDEYGVIDREKMSITEKLHNIAKELENSKNDYSKSLESAQLHSDETMSLKEERNELVKEKQDLESKIDYLNQIIDELKLSNTERLEIKASLADDLLQVKVERDQLKDDQNKLRKEQSKLREERDKLVLKVQSVQNEILEINLVSKSTNEELSVLKKEYADMTTENNNIQKEIKRLQACLKKSTENSSLLSEANLKLSQENSLIKEEIDELLKEKSIVENLSKHLEHDLSICKKELSKVSDEHKQMTENYEDLQKDYEDLLSGKQTEEIDMNEIKNALKQKEEMLVMVNENNHKLSEEMKILKIEFDQVEKLYKSLQEKHDSSVAEFESNKCLLSSVTKMKNKLLEEVNHLRENCKNNVDILNETNKKLDHEQNTTADLNNRLHTLSDSLNEKCKETNQKHEENLSLKANIEKLTKEKHIVLDHLRANLGNVKIIKQLQKSLYEFVKEFQVEISREIDDINLKMGHDLLKHLNDLLDPETKSSKFNELECKSKEDIDSYNSKLKNLQVLSKHSEELSQGKAATLENAYLFEQEPVCKMEKCNQLELLGKTTEQGKYNAFEVEVYLKQAISLMKSFTNILNHNSVNSDYTVDMFSPDCEKYIKLNEIDVKNLQKEIVAMESFITDCETKYSKNSPMSAKSKDANQFANLNVYDDSLEMKLRQEIRLKDDIIKKLQIVIEEYEQKKDIDDNDFVYKQKVHMLEQENKLLTDKLQQLQETHELNVKNIICEFEKKLEDFEEESNLYDFEKLGKEKNHVVSEMKEQIQNLQQDLEERGDAFEKLYEEHQQNVKCFDEEVHHIRSNHDKELREQDKKWRQCLDRRLAEEETRHQQELTALNMQWNTERRELETARRLAINAVESGSGSNELLRRQVQALTVQLAELRNNRCEACDRKIKSDLGKDSRRTSLQDCTEMEYLRNILYEYMMGKEPLVLAKVLCALVKFDENQTKEIVSKEEHRITLFGQLGLL